MNRLGRRVAPLFGVLLLGLAVEVRAASCTLPEVIGSSEEAEALFDGFLVKGCFGQADCFGFPGQGGDASTLCAAIKRWES